MITCRTCKGLDDYCTALSEFQAAQVDPDGYEARTGRPASGVTHPDAGLAPMDSDTAGGVYGWDIGGRVDSTAGAKVVVTPDGLAVLTDSEELPLRSGRDDLGYDEWSAQTIVSRVRAFRSQLGKAPGRGHALFVLLDETGPGRTIAAQVKRSLACTPGVRVILVSITAGDAPSLSGDAWSVPKGQLMEALVTAVQQRNADAAPWLTLVPGGERVKLLRQVDSVEVTELPSGHLKIESRGHDDLVIAAALATYMAKHALSGAGDVSVALNPARHVPKTATGRTMAQHGGSPTAPDGRPAYLATGPATAPEADRPGTGIIGMSRERLVNGLAAGYSNEKAVALAALARRLETPATSGWVPEQPCEACDQAQNGICRDHATEWLAWRAEAARRLYGGGGQSSHHGKAPAAAYENNTWGRKPRGGGGGSSPWSRHVG